MTDVFELVANQCAYEREKQIAARERAVSLLKGMLLHPMAKHYDEDADTLREILAREQAALAELKKGMKWAN